MSQETKVDLSTKNTLSEQLANMNLTQENIVSIVTGLNEVMSGASDSVDVKLTMQDGSTKIVTLKSSAYLSAEVARLSNTLAELTNLNPENAASIIDESGQHRKIIVGSYNKTIAGDVNAIEKATSVSVNYESLLYDLMFPSTKVVFTLPNDFLLVDEVLVKTFRFSDFSTFTKVSEGMSYAEVVSLANQSKIVGTWYEDVYKTNKRTQRYYGSFDVLTIDSFNTDGTIDITVQSTKYNDANSIEATRELYTDDILVTRLGNAKFQIVSVDHFKKKIRLKQIAGITQLAPGVGALQYLYEIEDETRELQIPIHGNERTIAFFLPVNPMSSATGIISRGYTIDTSTLVVYESGNPIYFDTYYSNKVTNVGSYLQQLISDSAIAFSNGIKPDKPILKTEFFSVLQINKHLADNSRVDKINKLSEEKEKVFGDISNVNAQISTVNSRINAGRYRSLADRTSDESKLSTLLAQKKSLTALYSSIVNDIDSKVNDEDLNNYTPKFRVRGFFPVQPPISSPVTRSQYIIKYKIEYRYCSPNTDISDATTIKYTSEAGDELHGTFSSWVEQQSPVLQKVKGVDGSITWAPNNTESGDEININQVDIPIKPGESVEIRVKALSEAGYPTTFTESDWSDVVRVEFPASLQNFTSLAATVEKNNEDKQKVEIQQMFTDIGIDDHLATSFKEQDKYFGHTAMHIASGFKTTEQTTISLFDYLNSLTNQISTLKAQVARSALEATIEIVDENNQVYTVQNFATMQLYAGAYMDTVGIADQSNWGKIIEKTFYLKISNKNATALDLISPNPGDINKNVDQSNKDYFFPLVSLSTISDTDKKVQYNGQILYARFKDVANQSTGSDLYYINEEMTPVVIPDEDKDGAAVEADKNVMDTSYVLYKLSKTAKTDFIALRSDHPLVAKYLTNQSTTNKENLVKEFERISYYNRYLKAATIQNAYSEKRDTSFHEYDKFLVGQNSCGARLFPKFTSLQNIQVNGSSSNSIRILNTGDTNNILIPIVFQYRMMDALGNIDGKMSDSVDNIEYSKKIGFDMIIGQQQFKFDIKVIANLRSNSITETNATRVNTIVDSINYNDDVTPSIQ